MVIIDKQGELVKYLESINFSSLGLVRLDQVAFELSQSAVDELTFIHEDVLKALSSKSLAKLNTLSMLIVFQNSKADLNLLDNIVDIIYPDTKKNIFENKVVLLSELIRERQVLKSQLISINGELSETMGDVEVELLKIKKIYERKAPKRFDNIKGIQIHSKYSAGENIGGEFFDVFIEGMQALIVMSSTSSYLLSSTILKLFSDLKQEGNLSLSAVESFVGDVKSNAIELNATKKKEVDIHLLVGLVDLSKHSASGYSFGEFDILSSKVNTAKAFENSLILSDLKSCFFFKEFERGERVLICSPGFVKNWRKLKPDFLIEELLMNKAIKPIDVLDEAFFQLKKDSSSSFLSYDASAIFVEVKKNAMVEV